VSEPNKSKKQLHKLIAAVSKYVLRRDNFKLIIKQQTMNSNSEIGLDDGEQA